MRIVWLQCEDYARLTGGFVYNSQLVEALRAQASSVDVLSVSAGFPTITGADRQRLRDAFAKMPSDTLLLSDHLHIVDLAADLAGRSFRVGAVFHHARAIEDESNGDPPDREAEQRGFDVCDLVIVTSQETADYVAVQHRFPAHSIVVAVPGTESSSRSIGPSLTDRLILTVGAIVPRKRHDYLIEVAARLQASDWHWLFVGDPDRDAGWTAGLGQSIEGAGLSDRVELAGPTDPATLDVLWARASLFVAASRHEGYGMAVAEALRRGIPVVTTASGAVATWARGGVVIAPDDDPARFASALDVLLADADARSRMADAAWTFGAGLSGWEQTFEGIAARLMRALEDAPASTAA